MKHIIKPLLHQRLMPLLVIVQVAIAVAIACNALFLLQQKLRPIMAPEGVGQPDHLIVVWQVASRGKPFAPTRLRNVQAALQALPGVSAVTAAGSFPMARQAKMSGTVIGMQTGVQANAAVYIGDNLLRTLDLKLVAGRDFSAAEKAVNNKEVFAETGPTIITQALADKLFPDGHALGQRLSLGKKSNAEKYTVVGVIAHLMRNDFGSGQDHDLDYTLLAPGIPGQWPIPTFGVRVAASADPQQVMKSVKQVIKRMLGPDLVHGISPHYQTYDQLRHDALAQARAAVWLLAGVCLIVLIVTAAGIMGLTSYWVGQRRRQIGIRRALGARRRNILHDLQWENLLVVGVGVLLGLAAAYGINLWLMHHYELSRLPWQYLPIGAALLLALGQLAVLAPALRAANVPPVVATRSV
jgi:putative ABC transport system permease protein